MATRILRLLEDYTPDPSAPSQEKFCKKNLLLEVGDRKDGWVLVKQLPFYDSVPCWVPEHLVTKAAPGFYRLRYSMQCGRRKIPGGHIVKVLDIKRGYMSDMLEPYYNMKRWEVDMLDGRGTVHWFSPLDLEPATDVALEPPKTPGPLKSFFGSMTRGRGHTVGEAGEGAPPPYHQDATEKPAEM